MEQPQSARWLLRVLGFVLGLAVAVAGEFLLIWILSEASGRNVRPRGLGWIVVPVLVGIAGAKILPSLNQRRAASLFGDSQGMRQGIALCVSWFILVFGYNFLSDDYIDRDTMVKWLLVPPAIAYVIRILLGWAFSMGGTSTAPGAPVKPGAAPMEATAPGKMPDAKETYPDTEAGTTSLDDLARRIEEMKKNTSGRSGL